MIDHFERAVDKMVGFSEKWLLIEGKRFAFSVL